MKKVTTFEEVLEAADRLSLEEQEAVMDIIRRRVIDERRKEIVDQVHEARKEYQEGRCREVNPKRSKTGILLSQKEYKTLIQDLKDLAIIAERKDEVSEPLEVVKEKLLKQWNTGSK